VDEQQASQQLGQRWVITAYIAVYIKGLYTGYNGARVQSTVAMLELAGDQGRRQPPQGSSPSTGLRRAADEVRCRSSYVVSAGVADTASVEAVKE
jgi:hypothetical protein